MTGRWETDGPGGSSLTCNDVQAAVIASGKVDYLDQRFALVFLDREAIV